jgi:flavin reductase (DIM6/NTAB) family NADH-FMN oxidoreductase RutF
MKKEIKIDEFKFDAYNRLKNDWALVTAKKKNGDINCLTVSWGAYGQLWGKPIFIAFVRPERFTHEFLVDADYYSVCFFNKEYQDKLLYIGRNSGRNEDKIKKMGLNVINDNKAPYYEESALTYICKKIYVDDFKKENFIDNDIYKEIYEKAGAKCHTIFIGEIVSILKEED